jgi:outer membrane protein assembly factor BamB
MLLVLPLLAACSPGLKLDWFLLTGDYSPVPAVSDGGLLVSAHHDTWSGEGTTKVFDPDEGGDRWSFGPDLNGARSRVIDAQDNVLVLTDEALLALAADDGSESWRFEQSGTNFALAVDVTLDRVYFLRSVIGESTTTWLSALEQGDELWSKEVPLFSAVLGIGADGTIYLAGDQAVALDPDGDELWREPLPSSAATLAVDRDRLVITTPLAASGEPGLVALSRTDGSTLWTTAHRILWDPALDSDGVIYAPADEGLVAIDGASGETLWTGMQMQRAVTVGRDGLLYGMGTMPDEPDSEYAAMVMCFAVYDPASGEVLWQQTQNEALDSANGAPTLHGRRAYFAGGYFRAHVYAFHGGPGLGHGPWPRGGADNANRFQEQD